MKFYTFKSHVWAFIELKNPRKVVDSVYWARVKVRGKYSLGLVQSWFFFNHHGKTKTNFSSDTFINVYLLHTLKNPLKNHSIFKNIQPLTTESEKKLFWNEHVCDTEDFGACTPLHALVARVNTENMYLCCCYCGLPLCYLAGCHCHRYNNLYYFPGAWPCVDESHTT